MVSVLFSSGRNTGLFIDLTIDVCFGCFSSIYAPSLPSPKAVIIFFGEVDDETITTRDLQINQFMNEYDNILAGYVDKREPLKEMVWEHLLGSEAFNLMSRDEIDRDYPGYQAQFLKKTSQDKLWKSMGVSDDEIKSLLRRRLAAKKLIHLKIPIELIEVSDQEVQTYYMQNRTQLGMRPIDELKPKILKGLREKKAQNRMRDWVNAVARSHSAVYLSGFRVQ